MEHKKIRIQLTEANYASQISCLTNDQKNQYRQLILDLNDKVLLGKKDQISYELLNDFFHQIIVLIINYYSQFHDELYQSDSNVKKEPDVENRLSESFTIHLGNFFLSIPITLYLSEFSVISHYFNVPIKPRWVSCIYYTYINYLWFYLL